MIAKKLKKSSSEDRKVFSSLVKIEISPNERFLHPISQKGRKYGLSVGVKSSSLFLLIHHPLYFIVVFAVLEGYFTNYLTLFLLFLIKMLPLARKFQVS